MVYDSPSVPNPLTPPSRCVRLSAFRSGRVSRVSQSRRRQLAPRSRSERDARREAVLTSSSEGVRAGTPEPTFAVVSGVRADAKSRWDRVGKSSQSTQEILIRVARQRSACGVEIGFSLGADGGSSAALAFLARRGAAACLRASRLVHDSPALGTALGAVRGHHRLCRRRANGTQSRG